MVPPPPRYAHWRLAAGVLVLMSLVWALLACAGCCVPDGRGAALLGRDNHVPPHTAWWVYCPPRCVARGRGEGLGVGVRVLPRVVNTILLRSPTWERVPPVGAEQGVSGASGRASVGLAGRWWRAAVVACSLAWCIQSSLLVAGGVVVIWCERPSGE